MNSVSVNQFRGNLKTFVEQVIDQHTPLKVTRRKGRNFVVIGAEDWEREQETLYVLQNRYLMDQITKSLLSHSTGKGYSPTQEELNEILGV